MGKPRKIIPSLNSIIVRGRFIVQNSCLEKIDILVYEQFRRGEGWRVEKGGNTFAIGLDPDRYAGRLKRGSRSKWFAMLDTIRPGYPIQMKILVTDKSQLESTVDVECFPCMYFKITQQDKVEYPAHVVEEAQIDCRLAAAELMLGILHGKEVIPLSVTPILREGEIKNRLTNLGLQGVSQCLDDSEKHLAQHNYEDCLHKSRTALEKMIDYVMAKRALEQTNQATNNLERLRKGFFGDDTTELLKQLYHYLSNVGTHQKGVKPGIFEARLGYNLTLVALEYLMDRL